jgi:hypothetical protein
MQAPAMMAIKCPLRFSATNVLLTYWDRTQALVVPLSQMRRGSFIRALVVSMPRTRRMSWKTMTKTWRLTRMAKRLRETLRMTC